MSGNGSMRHGQGKGTVRKQRGFETLFRMLIRMTNGESMRDRTFWHFHGNCGSGWNDKIGCQGSPGVFMDAWEHTARPDRRCNVMFCDDDPTATQALWGR